MTNSIENLSPKDYIIIKGARVHNLKNIDVAIPRNHLVVITGLSGSGKSSLAFSTLYAEGQRRYIESLSSYARQFLGKIEKPDVDYIKGVAPAIAIEQKVSSTNSRSTVGTTTEIYDYLKLLFARIGKTYSPTSGKLIKRESADDVVNFILQLEEGSKAMLITPLDLNKKLNIEEQKSLLSQQGYSRWWNGKESMWVEDLKETDIKNNSLELIIDRYQVNEDLKQNNARVRDSVEIALFEGKSKCKVIYTSDNRWQERTFNNLFEENGVMFHEPSVHFFSFNNPIGACPKCEGFGKVIGIDEDLVIPNKSLSVYQDAVVCWKGDKMLAWKSQLIKNAERSGFPIHKPIHDLDEKSLHDLWYGNKFFDGIYDFFDYLSSKSYKIQYRVMLARYRGRTICPDCKGTRLRKETNYVKIDQKTLMDLVLMSINNLSIFFDEISLSEKEIEITERLIIEIKNRLSYLKKVGVGYLSLNRPSNSLSGGETQRINLATTLGSNLVGSMYILDEPSIGLHSRDTEKLIEILKSLRDLGNTVVVVEHDEDIIKAADTVIDLGPEAGSNGGNLVFNGNQKELISADTLTAKYLRKELKTYETSNRESKDFIHIEKATENNLKSVDASFPLRCLTVVSGLSGSGKSTLIKKILYPALLKHLGGYGEKVGSHQDVNGALNQIDEVQFIDQNPIGKSSRSNPVTYIKAYDEIRALYSNLGLAKSRGYKPSHFSFNVEGGRCEVCQGEGEITEEMQFMADIHLTCEACEGKRFKDEILEVKFHNKSIADILDLTVAEAIEFFSTYVDNKQAIKISEKLQTLSAVGLDYVKLGQASGTLSGGEAQRIKLATYLGKGSNKNHILFLFDEPTTGLHYHDISKLLKSFESLLKLGHSIVVIEHNLEVIKQADWLIDLGPEGGEKGGEIVFQGQIKDLKSSTTSITAKYL